MKNMIQYKMMNNKKCNKRKSINTTTLKMVNAGLSGKANCKMLVRDI